MKELSLNILDIAENSVKAGASLTEIIITEQQNVLTLIIKDDGCGMSEEVQKKVIDPFYTTRTTRNVGLGVPLLKMEAEQTGGNFEITSSVDADTHGTTVKAVFLKDSIDFTPLGDVISSVTTLIQGHPDTDFSFSHTIGESQITLETKQLREILGEVPLNGYEVIKWIEEYLKEQYEQVN